MMADLLDQAFRIPGTRYRFGIDPLLGLLPGAGDLVTALIGAYGVLIARQLGAPLSVQVRMLLNLGIDGLLGAIPFLGDLFDFGFKAHVRNRVLLEKWLSRPGPVQRGSLATLLVCVLVLLLIAGGTVWVAVQGISWLIAELRS
jgi:hypothetical protein